MSEWKEVQLGDISHKITKGTTPTTLGLKFRESGINFIKSESILDDGRIDKSKFAFIDVETHQRLSRSIIQEKDILFSMAGVYLGKVALVTSNLLPANTNQAVAIIRINEKLANPHFVKYYLSDKRYRQHIESLTAQSAQPNISLSTINELTISIPLRQEQDAIVKILSCLDRKIENLRRQNDTLERIAQTLFKHWFIDFEFPNEDGKPYKSSGGGMEGSELGEIPVGWNVGTLSEIALFKNGKSPPEKNEDSKIPIYGSNGVIGNTTIANNQKTVIIGRVGSYCGSLYYYLDQCWVTDNAMTGHLKKHKSHAYLYLFLASSRLNKLSGGSGQPLLNQSILSSIELGVPDNYLIRDFEEIADPLFTKIFFNQNSIQTLTKTRDVLLPKLMSGQLRISE
ncbi:MAG TPA: restriction endonuclease subunit S [Candidatus Sericytochromatia bacterium]